MKAYLREIRLLILILLALAGFVTPLLAQTVSIPDPGLNAAIHAALNKPSGLLTEQDLLNLTNLNARNRNIGSLQGLEAARNLVSLDLQVNHLTNFSIPQLTNLLFLDLSGNPLPNSFVFIGPTNLTSFTARGKFVFGCVYPGWRFGLCRQQSSLTPGYFQVIPLGFSNGRPINEPVNPG